MRSFSKTFISVSKLSFVNASMTVISVSNCLICDSTSFLLLIDSGPEGMPGRSTRLIVANVVFLGLKAFESSKIFWSNIFTSEMFSFPLVEGISPAKALKRVVLPVCGKPIIATFIINYTLLF